LIKEATFLAVLALNEEFAYLAAQPREAATASVCGQPPS